MGGLAGRTEAQEAVAALLTASATGPAILLVDGEAGMGKTTLLRETVRLARRANRRVLGCRPAAAESMFSFAGLTDLLADVDDRALDDLPPPQRTALSAAVLRADPGSAEPDERAIGTGLATLFAQRTEQGPVLVTVDDAQWLDPPTRAALTFALRRIGSIPLGVMVCSRTPATDTGDTGATTAAAELGAGMVDRGWSRSLTLRGLGDTDLFHVVRDRLGVPLSRPQLTRIGELSEGNPFVAIELARGLLASDDPTGTEVSVPPSLQALTARQLLGLTDAASDAVLAVACAARPTLSLLAQLGLAEGAEEAEREGIVAAVGGRVEFTHPLLATAALGLAGAPAVRSMHARLGTAVIEPELVARHRALAVPEPDDSVAAALDAAVDSAAVRGAASAALDLARLALDRTVDPDGPAAWERRVRLAERLHVSGSTLEAGQNLDGIAERCPAGPVRVRGWLLLTEVAYQTSSVEQAVRCCRAALADEVDDPALRARGWLSLAVLTTDPSEATRHVAAARACLEGAAVQDPQLLAWVACEEVSARFYRGEGLDRAALDDALALERSGRLWRSADQVAAIRPVLLKWADHHVDALAGLEELRDKAREEGNDGLLPYASGHMSSVLLRMGRTQQASAVAAQHLADAEASAQESQRVQAWYNIALVEAHLGHLDEAWKIAAQIEAWGEREHDGWLQMSAAGVFGFIALSRDDAPSSRTWLDRWFERCEQLGLIDPGISRHHGDHVDALLATGAVDEAAARTGELEARARRADRVSAAAVAARCRGLLASTSGDHDAAAGHLVEALRLHETCDVPFERARTLLAAGVAHRRAKRKRAARGLLAEAVSGFAQLDAAAWVVRAQAELDRVAGRAGPSLELTPSERRVSELAASGLTNRQVAERAYISPKTVEATLARAYRKLGISSRAELGARMAVPPVHPLLSPRFSGERRWSPRRGRAGRGRPGP